MIMKKPTKKSLLEWLVILGMSSLGTVMAAWSWLNSPQGQEVMRSLVRA